MLTHPSLLPLLLRIYPLPQPSRTRTVPLQLICIGLPRSGTDSLRRALLLLSLVEVHHAYHYLDGNIGETPQWLRLAWRKYYTDASLSLAERGLDASEFDKVIGDCMAVTDIPSVGLAAELIGAYPGAKVVVNRRDKERWWRSVRETLENGERGTWRHVVVSLFDSECFWLWRLREGLWVRMFGGDFVKNGRGLHDRHYGEIETVLKREEVEGRERKVLRWGVEDGWAPLCEFLEVEVPRNAEGREVDFPSGNEPGKFAEMRKTNHGERLARARRRRNWVVGIVIAGIVCGLAWYLR